MREKINFNRNWNNKLDCESFTTIRIANYEKYKIGKEYDVYLNNSFVKKVVIVEVRTMLLRDVNEHISQIDMGLCKEQAQITIKQLYPRHQFNTQVKPKLMLLLLKTI